MSLDTSGGADPLLKERNQERISEFRRLALKPLALFGYVAAVAAGIGINVFIWPAVTLVVLFWAAALADKKARADWWESLVRTIGMTSDVPALDFATPLLRSGDERKVDAQAHDDARVLALFTSTDVSHDSKGNREENNHHYTLLIYDFTASEATVPSTMCFLSAHRRGPLGIGDDHRGSFPSAARDFDLESVELNKKFNLRCDRDQVDVLHAVFDPAFMVWFQEHGLDFEFESGKLVVIHKTHLQRLTDFQDLMTSGDAIHAQLVRKLVPGAVAPPPAPAPAG